PVNGRVSTNSVEAAYQMTLADFGIGNLPSLLVAPAIADGRLEPLLEEFRPSSSPIYALYPHRTYVAMKVRTFVDSLTRDLSPDFDGHKTRAGYGPIRPAGCGFSLPPVVPYPWPRRSTSPRYRRARDPRGAVRTCRSPARRRAVSSGRRG